LPRRIYHELFVGLPAIGSQASPRQMRTTEATRRRVSAGQRVAGRRLSICRECGHGSNLPRLTILVHPRDQHAADPDVARTGQHGDHALVPADSPAAVPLIRMVVGIDRVPSLGGRFGTLAPRSLRRGSRRPSVPTACQRSSRRRRSCRSTGLPAEVLKTGMGRPERGFDSRPPRDAQSRAEFTAGRALRPAGSCSRAPRGRNRPHRQGRLNYVDGTYRRSGGVGS
jgi:hypothetical protein